MPVARVTPAVKVGVVNPQVSALKSPSSFPAEELRTYAVEGTPVEFSPSASLSDITIDTPPLQEDRRGKPSKGVDDFSPPELSKPFGGEAGPASYLSLGAPSEATPALYQSETTPREEALLRRCINQGMPRGTPSRIPQVTSVGRGLTPPTRMTPGVPMSHLLLSRTSPNSSNSSLASEAESRKLHTENEESEKQSPRWKPPSSATAAVVEDKSEESSATATTVIPARKEAHDSSSSPEEGRRPSPDRTMEQSTPSSGSAEMRSDASLSESQSVLAEALRLAKAVSKDAARPPVGGSSDEISVMSASVASASSACIDLIKPPSAMGSLLSLSTSSVEEGRPPRQAPTTPKKLECRHTKKMPEMVRRALGEQEAGGAECASLNSSCHSNIDNIMPPSLVEDDMESSMISVASITSEVVEPKDSPPSVTDGHSEIAGHARHIASLLQKEAQGGVTSSLTLTAGDEASTCQEVTDLDETLGAHHPDGAAASDTEVAIDDLPQDIPDLPFDSPLRQRRRGGSPRLAAGPRRSQLKDRLKTFTRDSSSPDSSRGTPESPRSPAQQRTARQRRADDAERFRTRTISYSASAQEQMDSEVEEAKPDVEELLGKIVPVQQGRERNSSVRRSFRQRRNEDPSRYQTRTIDVPMTQPQQEPASDHDEEPKSRIVEFHDGEDLCLTAAQMEVLSQDANIVICSLNETREAMTTSDAGADFPEENILDIETLSLISNEDEEEMLQLLMEEDETGVGKGPRIVKPGEERQRPSEEEPPQGKGIRGRRRALYSSGRHQGHVPCSTKQQQQSRTAVAPKQPRATRASTLRQSTNSTRGGGAGGGGSSSEDSPRQSSSPASSAGSSPKLGGGNRASSATVVKTRSKETLDPFRRQNTFTKEDAEAERNSNRKGVTARTPKGRVRKDGVQPSQSHPVSSDWCARPKDPLKSASLTRDANPPSAKDVAEWGAEAKGGSKAAKKDVTSRIANLWKRVEKAQGSASKTPSRGRDDRVWISGGPKEAPPANRPLVRSSTFEKESQAGKGGGRAGLGLKLSRLKGRDTRSSPPSEVSTPVDARPQCLVSPTRVAPRPRPATHPSAGPPTRAAAQDNAPDAGKEKRLSRLGSFVVVDEKDEAGTRGRAVVAPFSYRGEGEPPQRASSMTRIPQPSKPLQNKPRDDNGNAAVIN